MTAKKNKNKSPQKTKKAASKKIIKNVARKKSSPKKKASPETTATKAAKAKALKPGQACICIENNEGWFCMKQLPSGELKECDGPFDTQGECESHTCI
jgi:hypothetical protein